jgi:steroid 5-alpha reductase family enzyme
MLESDAYAFSLAAVIVAAVAVWALSVVERDVSIVDVLWGPMFLIASLVFAALVDERGPRAVLVIALTTVWAMRLSAYIAWRKLGEPEDRRYQAIRRRNEPHFAFKSLYLVFGLQAGLAWIVSLPLLASVGSPGELGALDYAGAAVWITGLAIEAIADWQLARFKADARSRGRVLDSGLWRYSRHPNYFGEFLIWWGAYLIALSAGAWWTVLSPLLMSVLLLRVSGVVLLEKDIANRRPAYAHYRSRTNAFFPGPPRRGGGETKVQR